MNNVLDLKTVKALILDRDGTLTETVSGDTFPQNAQDLKLRPGVREAIAHYVEDGWTPIVASNQGGVGAGFKTLQDAVDEMAYLMQLLPEIEVCLFCPETAPPRWLRWLRYFGLLKTTCITVKPDGAFDRCSEWFCDEDMILWAGSKTWGPGYSTSFRKPGGLMLYLATQLSCLGLSPFPLKMMYVGDRPEDEEAARNANIDFMWEKDWLKTEREHRGEDSNNWR